MSLPSFLAHAVKLEYEAEKIYRETAELITRMDPSHAGEFFKEMAGYAKQHLDSIMHRAGITDITELPQVGYIWGTDPVPESIAPPPAADSGIDLDDAMALALDAERRAAAFYAEVATTSLDPIVKVLANTFAAEEREHVLALERFMGAKPY